MKLRVAYLSLLAPPDEPAVSGVPKVSETLLAQFEKIQDIEVLAVTMIDGLDSEREIRRGSVTYRYLSCKPRWKTATLYRAETRRLIEQVRGSGAQIVHGQPSGEYLLAATAAPLPHVITIHGLVFRETAGLSILKPGFAAMFVRERLQKRAIRRASNIISISPYVDEYLKGCTSARLWPVSNPIDPEFFDAAPAGAAGLRILCVGVLSERKNQAALIQACRLLADRGIDFECRIVGKALPGYDEVLQGLIGAAGLTGRISLPGVVSREQLLESYAWATAIVLPSREETSPLSLIQGMAAGRCVFGANAAGIPALLQDGKYGTLFSPDRPADLALALKSFAENRLDFALRATEAQAFARENFHPVAVAAKTVEVYRRILGA